MAFDFNSTNFFKPNENKTSEILAFFLNPKSDHGQKTTFLNIFIKNFCPGVPLLLLNDMEHIYVNKNAPTADKRLIDITIHFGKDEYIIGIENKIGTAWDQPNQIQDYAKELNSRAGGVINKWVLFYLTPTGVDPSEESIRANDRERLKESGNLLLISYYKNIINLFELFETACKADSVRAFLKDFRQYLKQKHTGETTMGEIELTEQFIRDYPKVFLHIDLLCSALNKFKQVFRDDFLAELCRELKINRLDLAEESQWRIEDWGFSIPFHKKHDINGKPLGFRIMWLVFDGSYRLLIGLGPELECDFGIDQQKLELVRKELDEHFGDCVDNDVSGDYHSLAWVTLCNGFMTNEFLASVHYERPMKDVVDPMLNTIIEYINFCTCLFNKELERA